MRFGMCVCVCMYPPIQSTVVVECDDVIMMSFGSCNVIDLNRPIEFELTQALTENLYGYILYSVNAVHMYPPTHTHSTPPHLKWYTCTTKRLHGTC